VVADANGNGVIVNDTASADGIAFGKNIEEFAELICAAAEPANIRTKPIANTTCFIA